MLNQTRLQYPDLRGLTVPPAIRKLCSGYRVARWDFPADLSPHCRERLHTMLCELAARAFGADHSDYWRTRVDAGFFDQISTLALILGPDGTPVGWGGYHRCRFAGRRALYLDAAGVLPDHRRFGLSRALTTHFLTREVFARPHTSTYVVLRTQHPAVYAAWLRGLGPKRVFPNEHRPVPAPVRRIAAGAAAWLGDGDLLESETMLIRDAYRVFDGDVYGHPPRSGHPHLDDYFATEVGPKDAVLLVARTSAAIAGTALAARALRARAVRRPWQGGRPVRGAVPRDPASGTAPTGAGPTGLIPGTGS